jgi:hypothetical protein
VEPLPRLAVGVCELSVENGDSANSELLVECCCVASWAFLAHCSPGSKIGWPPPPSSNHHYATTWKTFVSIVPLQDRGSLPLLQNCT